jgi:hypothetical protein
MWVLIVVVIVLKLLVEARSAVHHQNNTSFFVFAFSLRGHGPSGRGFGVPSTHKMHDSSLAGE